VSFTGGTSTGRRIGHVAAEKLMPVSLELGGKSPTIVLADADVELALAGILYGIFSSSGQSCIAGSRLFVAEPLYDQLVAELVARTRALRVGHGLDPCTQVAPLVHAAHRDRVAQHVERARADGARVLAGGEAPRGPGYDEGSYYLPTVLDGLPPTAAACQEEIFGPVLVALPFTDEADLDPRLPRRVAAGPPGGGGHGVDQHLQAVQHLDALRRHEGQRHRSGEGARGHRRVLPPEEHLLGPGRASDALGLLTLKH
jgi:acyl-CoA reductase-like NAD-dependent aldehyde dehydrogenase